MYIYYNYLSDILVYVNINFNYITNALRGELTQTSNINHISNRFINKLSFDRTHKSLTCGFVCNT